MEFYQAQRGGRPQRRAFRINICNIPRAVPGIQSSTQPSGPRAHRKLDLPLNAEIRPVPRHVTIRVILISGASAVQHSIADIPNPDPHNPRRQSVVGKVVKETLRVRERAAERSAREAYPPDPVVIRPPKDAA